MSKQEVLDLDVMVDLMTAAKALDMSRTMAYRLAAQEHFPITLEKFGSRYRLRRSDLLAYLGISDTDDGK
ncbi:helix-turn-helix domain-containing protein [Kineosporia succinea]|uniref:DNA-binding transcriptional regulator AlpA n=1 Tax=Kineosporia succinea TaxID=84632 RepID=A0ABT9NXQ1_9ACTN|nr:helix-turn-helix domain-containing protein [Kineosporia succinea]MDP9825198.1 putative DNA-binding transcriptional regulator AlpA [Kineosporia succinea]